MGLSAARLTDATSHGSPLFPGPGCTTVLIGGLPAWRSGSDTIICPLFNGPQPHGAGVVTMGSATVFIGGLPAARVGDPILEPGGPNAIARGATDVLIG